MKKLFFDGSSSNFSIPSFLNVTEQSFRFMPSIFVSSVLNFILASVLFFAFTLLSPKVFAAYSNKVLGEAGTQVITQRDVEIQYMLELHWYSDLKNQASFPLTADVLKDETSNTLLETIVFEEAKSFAVAKLSDNELESQVQLIKQYLRKSPVLSYWNSLEVSEKEFKDFCEKKLRAKKFIQFKRRSSDVAISDAEAETYFNENKNKFAKAKFADFKERIKLFLRTEQADLRLRDWFESLRRKYKVRNLLL